jgi:hypothetical protein
VDDSEPGAVLRRKHFSRYDVKALSRLLVQPLNFLAVDNRAPTRSFPFRFGHMSRAVPKTNAAFQGVEATTLQHYSAAST